MSLSGRYLIRAFLHGPKGFHIEVKEGLSSTDSHCVGSKKVGLGPTIAEHTTDPEKHIERQTDTDTLEAASRVRRLAGTVANRLVLHNNLK